MNPFEFRLLQSWPLAAWREVGVVVAVSGGADSVALLRALHAIKTGGAGRLVVAHFNHLLRGDDSDCDEQFVVKLAAELGLACEVGRAAAPGTPANLRDGLEAAARAARYDFLKKVAERVGARYVATAHTADDKAETILHRILRGTGIAGLAGIPRSRLLTPAVSLLRPMLPFRRAEVLAYLHDLGQPFRQDDSNRDTQFTRNRIRHELLPLLAEHYHPGVREALLRLSQLASGAQSVIDELVREQISRRVRFQGNDGGDTVTIDVREIGALPRHLVRELLLAVWREMHWPEQSMGFAQWELLADMAAAAGPLDHASSIAMLPGGIEARRQVERLVLLRGKGSGVGG